METENSANRDATATDFHLTGKPKTVPTLRQKSIPQSPIVQASHKLILNVLASNKS